MLVRLTPKLSCKRPRIQAVHQLAGPSPVQPLNRNASDVTALVSCSDTLGGRAVRSRLIGNRTV